MALPLAPVAIVALRYGAVAMATYALSRKVERGRRDQRAEDALDDVAEGVSLRRSDDQLNATGRIRRVFYVGKSTRGYQIDATTITRIRITKVS